MRLGFVWLAGIRDLQWRRRRFVISVGGTSVVFALTLLLTGFLATFDIEVRHALDMYDADGYVVQRGRAGRFTGTTPLPASSVEDVQKLPGVEAANGIISALQVIDLQVPTDVYVVGAPAGAMGSPTPKKGRVFNQPHEAVVDTSLGLKIGDKFELSGLSLSVVGLVSGQTVLAGQPVVFMALEDAQATVFRGFPVVTSIAVKGAPSMVPGGLAFVDRSAAAADLRRPQQDVVESIGLFRALLWLVVAAIVGSVIYLSALERVGDFAVFKATGVATIDLLAALVVQAMVVAVTSSLLSIGVAYLLAPQFPAAVSFSAAVLVSVPIIALLIGALASGAALRRAVTVDPALAFGGH